ncbi:hypothetical protein DPMN_171114 [Dreissena polymorpha]|uniref:Uncharacterized protein n=1 Tax=Dreissena polymorpha TaxID=45954 RepID=A0A9D4IEV8_DREPO|nr:hypothetical protein DPMN_171114 [Dreissena polymorpha]
MVLTTLECTGTLNTDEKTSQVAMNKMNQSVVLAGLCLTKTKSTIRFPNTPNAMMA